MTSGYAEKSQQYHKCFLQYSTYTSYNDLKFECGGSNFLAPGAIKPRYALLLFPGKTNTKSKKLTQIFFSFLVDYNVLPFLLVLS